LWTWAAICADTKRLPSWLVGQRFVDEAVGFMQDLSSRLANRVQLTTDGHKPHLPAVEARVRCGRGLRPLIKLYGEPADADNERRYSPADCTGIRKKGSLEPVRALVSTSYVKRQNLTMRTGMRRFNRLTNGSSKEVENLARAVSLHYMHYNFARPHKTLAKAANGDATRPLWRRGLLTTYGR